jgi:hypothetical protein
MAQVMAQVPAPTSPSPIVTASTEKLATVRRSAPVELDELGSALSGCEDAGGKTKWKTNTIAIGGGGKQKENASVILLDWWTECMANAAQQLDVVKAECPVDDQDIFELKDVLDADQQVIGHLLWGFCRITPSALLTLLISGYPHSHFSPAGPSASAANSSSLFVSPSAEFRHPP